MTRRRESPPIPNRQVWVWAVAYVAAYVMLLSFQNEITVTHFIVAESVAPALAVCASRDWKLEYPTLGAFLIRIAPLLLLFELARVSWDTTVTPVRALLFVLVSATFTVSQTAARHLSKADVPLLVSERLAGFNVLLLVPLALAIGPISLSHELWPSIPVGLGAVVVQCLFLYGLRSTPVVLAALLLATTVPMSVFAESAISGGKWMPYSISLAILYCCTAIYFGRKSPQAEP